MPNDKIIFPFESEKPRLDRYDHYDKIYRGDHFEAYSIKSEDGFSKRYSQLRYIVANFGGLISRVMADMLFGENISFDFQDERTQKYADSLLEKNHFVTQLYESSLVASRKGDTVFKIRIGKRNPINTDDEDQVIIEEIDPRFYYPVFDRNATRNTPIKHRIIVPFKQGDKTYLHEEIHSAGLIEHVVYEYDEDQQVIIGSVDPGQFNIPEVEETKVDMPLVIHIPNVRDGGVFWGVSDYRDLDQLFFALNNRLTKIDNILDKHSDPILAVPPGVIDEDGEIRKEALGMFEVSNDSSGFNRPEYIIWNANLEAAFNQLDKLIEMLFMFSEVSPATLGMDKSGVAESGRALKFRLLATIRKRNRKISYYDQGIKDVLKTSLSLAAAHNIRIDGDAVGEVERPNIIWGDGVINDDVEMVDIAVKRIDAGLSSQADEIVRLDGVSPDEAQEKVQEIEDEKLPTVEPVTNNLSVPQFEPMVNSMINQQNE